MITNEMRKSTKLVIMELAGMIMRGKYTLEIKLVFPIRLLLLSVSELAKNCHGNNPAKTRIEYGAVPSVGNFAIRPKIAVNTIIVNKGRIILHATPITVYLYRTLISRHDKI